MQDSPCRTDVTLNGSEVNLGARLEAHADVGGINLAHETYARVKHEVLAEEREALSAKGFAKPVRNYAVVGPYDDLVEQGRVIRQDREGLSLITDRGKLTERGVDDAVKALAAALSELRE